MKIVSLTISGQVQGVFYRVSARSKAQQLGLTGFVRNQTNDTVYIEVGGEEGNIRRFIDWCYIGSESSMVDKVVVKPLKSFSVPFRDTVMKGFVILPTSPS